jgi:ABC-2 type transport system ATP-binding protein
VTAALAVNDLKVAYGEKVAVDGISFEVEPGEIFGIVGPNGAGKTSTIECLEGLRPRTAGSVQVLGMDPQHERRRVQARIGCQLQESNLPDRLKVWEALELFASFYPGPVDRPQLLDALDLQEKRGAAYRELSGGQKQRLFIALALVGDPELVFMDELTTGLDPHARRDLWKLVLDVRHRGKTVVLSTHFMEEAERLCDRVAILDGGRLIALDTPAALVAGLSQEEVGVLTVDGDIDPSVLASVEGVTEVDAGGRTLRIRGRGSRLVADAVTALAKAGVRVTEAYSDRTTLEDVFLALTGKRIGTDEGADAGDRRAG